MLKFIEREDPELAALLREFLELPQDLLDVLRLKQLLAEVIDETLGDARARKAA